MLTYRFDEQTGNLYLRFERHGKVATLIGTRELWGDVRSLMGQTVEEILYKMMEKEWKEQYPFG